jgi:hypothetical protein
MEGRVHAIIERAALDGLLDALRSRGYVVVGPQVRSQSIVFDELTSADDLPAGWQDVQDGGTFRLERRDDQALFAHTVGHDSLKRLLFPPIVPTWRARRGDDGGLEVEAPDPPPRYAFVGLRSCDLHAVAIQDRVFLGDRYVEPDYEAPAQRRVLRGCQLRSRRRQLLLRLDGHGSAGHGQVRPGAHRAAR